MNDSRKLRGKRSGIAFLAGSVLMLGLAVPGFSLPTMGSALDAVTAELTEAFRYAHRYALENGHAVVISSREAEGDWSGGILVWTDTDADGIAGTDEILRQIGPLPEFSSLQAAGGSTRFSYSADGAIDHADDFDLCGPAGEGRRLSIGATGTVILIQRPCA